MFKILWEWAGSIFKLNLIYKFKRHNLSKTRLVPDSSLHFDEVCPSPATLKPPPPSSGSMEAAYVQPQKEIGGWKESVVRVFTLLAPCLMNHLQKPQPGRQIYLTTALSGFNNGSSPLYLRVYAHFKQHLFPANPFM